MLEKIIVGMVVIGAVVLLVRKAVVTYKTGGCSGGCKDKGCGCCVNNFRCELKPSSKDKKKSRS